MKRIVIILLVCLNIGLIGVLLYVSKAEAQVFGGSQNYIVVTGNVGRTDQALYIIDVQREQMLAWRFDEGRRKFVIYRGRQLKDDFK